MGLGRDMRRAGFQGFDHDRRRNFGYDVDGQQHQSFGGSTSASRSSSGGRRGEGGEVSEVRLAEVRSDGGESGMHTQGVSSKGSVR